MSAIHYKFSSSNEYKNITFDGISISLLDLKRAIMEKQKLKSTELDLHITNAQTLNVYKDDSTLIPKNTAVLVRRIPLGPVRDSKVYIVKRNDSSLSSTTASTKVVQEAEPQPKLTFDELTKASNLAEANASEDDKIKAAIHQSTNEYDPSNFYRPPKYGTYKYNASAPSTAATPSYVRCYRCNQHGHYSMHCPLPKTEVDKVKTVRLATGIPRSHMVEVSKEAKGAMLTTDGRYVVPVMDKKGYDIGKKEKPPFVPDTPKAGGEEEEEDEPIPDELICLLCKDLLVDAVVIPCCGNSYCDDCIRNALLDSETHQCPTCHKENISPDSLIANKFLRQAVNKFKNDTGIAKKKSNAPVWPRPAPSDKPKPKVAVQPTKVSYGPPQSRTENRLPSHLGAYVVKAKSEQIVSRPYTVAKQQIGGGSSPHEPNQPIRIKLAPSDATNESGSIKGEATPQMTGPKDQSTPADSASLPSQTPQSDSYTFNSTPDTGEEKPKVLPVEPCPPGISPPTAKVVRPLLENTIKTEPPTSGQPTLTGIHPLNQSHPEKVDSPMPDEPEPSTAEDQPTPSALGDSQGTETLDLAPGAEAIPTQLEATDQRSITSSNDDILNQNLATVEPPVQVNPPNSEGLGLLGTAPSSLSTIVVTDSKRQSSNASPALQPPVHVPPPAIAKPPAVNMAVPPPPLIPPVLPPGLANIPPPSIPTSGVNLFQHPPPPFPFNLLIPPPTSQPPPGFPPPPGLPLPHLASIPPPGLPLPPGTDSKHAGVPIHSAPPGHSARPPPARRARSPAMRRSPSRSPRRRQERGSRKSKLDIMSDEFAEKMLKKRSGDKKRGRRRSRSASYSSGSSYSSSSYSSSSRSSSSYSSYTGSSWSGSSYSASLSRSPSPRKRRKAKTKKDRARKRSKSWSSPGKSKSRSRKRRSATPKRRDSRRRRRSASKEKRRNRGSISPTPRDRRDRRHSPRRGARERSRTPPGARPGRRDFADPTYPAIPVISSHQNVVIPGLPSKEQADYERDQALYAHYRQAHERDWYERGIMPPPPYDRFVQPRFSRSPSPPGTGTRILPPPGAESAPRDAWAAQGQLITPSGLPADELYELQTNILREEQYYEGVQARLRAMAGGYAEGQGREDRRRRSPRRRYDDERGGRRGDGRRGGSRERYSSRHGEERKRRDRDGGYQDADGRGRRENAAPTAEEGDATPVRDERPSPSVEEELAKKSEEKVAPRRAGDNVKMGKISTSRRNRSDKQPGTAESREGRSDSKSRRSKDSNSKTKDSKPEESSRKLKQESRKEERKSDSKRSDRRKDEDREKSRKMTSDRSESKKSRSSGKKDSHSRKEDSKSSSKTKERKDDTTKEERKSSQSKTALKKEEKVATPNRETEPRQDTKDGIFMQFPEKAKSPIHKKVEERKETTTKIELPTVNQPEAAPDQGVTEDNSGKTPPLVEPQAPEKSLWKPLAEVPATTSENDAAKRSPKDEAPVRDMAPESVPTINGENPAVMPDVADKKQRPEEETAPPVKTKREKASKRKGEKKHKKSESSKKRKRADAGSEKKDEERERNVKEPGEEKKKPVVEYDGSAPPPTGDELIKITIPKSRWEESDDESKPKEHLQAKESMPKEEVQEKEVKPTSKGRRIKIKRKPPSDASSDVAPAPKVDKDTKEDEEKKSSSQNEIASSEDTKSEGTSGQVLDARVVITLRRNSKREEETRSRRVSLEEPPTKMPSLDQKTEDDKSVLAMKGKSIKVTSMRSSRRESEDFVQDDILDLSHPSGLSDPESEAERAEAAKKAAKKKKKKKKRKHKNRRRSTDETIEDGRSEEDLSPEPKRKFVLKNDRFREEERDSGEQEERKGSRSGRKAERREAKRGEGSAKRQHDSSREQSDRRERKRYRRDRYSESEDERDRQRSRSGRQRHEKRRGHRHRRRRDDYESESSSYDDEVDYRRSRRSLS